MLLKNTPWVDFINKCSSLFGREAFTYWQMVQRFVKWRTDLANGA